MASKKQTVPLIIEPHPASYTGLPFITLIQYKQTPLLTVVDNASSDYIYAYVLDMCGPEGIQERTLLDPIIDWYNNSGRGYPVSIEFARRGLTPTTSKLYKAINVELISRVIGPVPLYDVTEVKSVKRRRRKPIPTNVEVINYSLLKFR